MHMLIIGVVLCGFATVMPLAARATEAYERWAPGSVDGSNLSVLGSMLPEKAVGLERVRSLQLAVTHSGGPVSLLFERREALISLCRADESRISCRQYETDADDVIVAQHDSARKLYLVGPRDLMRECRLEGRTLALSCDAPGLGGLAAISGSRVDRNVARRLSTVVENDIISCRGTAFETQCSAPRAMTDPNRSVTMGRFSAGGALGVLAFVGGKPVICAVERRGVSNCTLAPGAESVKSATQIAWTSNLRGLAGPAIVALSESTVGTCVPRAHASPLAYDIDCRWTDVGTTAGLRGFLSSGKNPLFGESLVVAAPIGPDSDGKRLSLIARSLKEALASQARGHGNRGPSTKTFDQVRISCRRRTPRACTRFSGPAFTMGSGRTSMDLIFGIGRHSQVSRSVAKVASPISPSRSANVHILAMELTLLRSYFPQVSA